MLKCLVTYFFLAVLGWAKIYWVIFKSKGNPFGPMPNLMAVAEFVTKVHAICSKTGNLANFSHRISENDELVLLGEKLEYEPLSRAAFKKVNKLNQ